MKCFNHHEMEAVAICKNCHKALCDRCATEVGDGIACQNKCEDQVRTLNALQRRADNALKRSILSLYGLAAFLFFLGLGFALNIPSDTGQLKVFSILMTVFFEATAIVTFFFAKKAGTDAKS